MYTRNPYLATLPKAQPSLFGKNKNNSQELADTIKTGGKVIGAIVGGVAGAYAGGPMGALEGASTGASIGGAGADQLVTTFSIDGKERSAWERLKPSKKSAAAAKSLQGMIGK